MMERKDEGLQSLGKHTEYKDTYAPEVLETFNNMHPDNEISPRSASAMCPM